MSLHLYCIPLLSEIDSMTKQTGQIGVKWTSMLCLASESAQISIYTLLSNVYIYAHYAWDVGQVKTELPSRLDLVSARNPQREWVFASIQCYSQAYSTLMCITSPLYTHLVMYEQTHTYIQTYMHTKMLHLGRSINDHRICIISICTSWNCD